MRSPLLVPVLCMALTGTGMSQATRFVIATDSSDSGRSIRARFVGWFQVDSSAVQIRVDSATVWIASAGKRDRHELIGGLAPFLGGSTLDGGWTVWADGDVASVGVEARVGDTIRVPVPLGFTVDRSRLGRVDSMWLGMEILLNRLNARGGPLDTRLVSTYFRARTTLAGNAVRPDTGSHQGKYEPPIYQTGTCHFSSLGSAHGQVFLEFAVDTSGRVEPESFRVFQATEPALVSSAILDTRPCRFIPARAGGMAIRVRQSRVIRY